MNPKDRPDYEYWNADRKARRLMDVEELTEKVRVYSEKRFTEGRRFRLTRAYAGTPAGTGCTVTRLWPDTRVLWDKWGKHGGRETSVSYELDIILEPEDERTEANNSDENRPEHEEGQDDSAGSARLDEGSPRLPTHTGGRLGSPQALAERILHKNLRKGGQ